MSRAYLQPSGSKRILSSQVAGALERSHAANLGSRAVSLPLGSSPSETTLHPLQRHEADSTQEFFRMISQLLPDTSVDILSGQQVEASDSQPAIILADEPALSLAWCIQKGVSPDRALDEWKEAKTALLVRHRRDRNRVILVDPVILEPTMAQWRDALIARLEKVLPNPHSVVRRGVSLETAAPLVHSGAPDPNLMILALALLSDPRVAETVQELRAVTIGAKEPCDIRSVSVDAWKSTLRMQERAELLSENVEQQLLLRQEISRKLSALEERLAQSQQALANERLRAQRENEHLVAEKASIEARRAHAQRRIEALEERLAQSQQALANERLRAQRENEHLVAEKASIEARRAHAQRRIEALLASRSWRATRPLRALTRFVPRRS